MNRLQIIFSLLSRKGIPKAHKLHLILSYVSAWICVKLRFKKIYFLGYKINYRNSSNTLNIMEEIFLRIDYQSSNDKKSFIIDCGANIGIATLFFKRYFPEAKILSFEPSPENFRILGENITQNGLSGVEIINMAVSKERKEISFWDNNQKPGGSTAKKSSSENKKIENFSEIKVQSVPLSEYINQPVDLLKIDIEGSEYDVIEDLDSKGKLKMVKEIVMECHISESSVFADFSNLLGILIRNGFTVVIYNPEAVDTDRAIKKDMSHFMLRAALKHQ